VEAWRRFAFPLNVFLHVLGEEEREVAWLHYGVFSREDEPLPVAQERATGLLLSRLPPPPARVLDVGAGLGTTLARLAGWGYDAEGVTPSEAEVDAIRARHGDALRVHLARFEALDAPAYDAVVFHESSQYVDAAALFARARALTRLVVVLDEFALRDVSGPGALHSRDRFLAEAGRHGFSVIEELDLTAKAAPTMAYFARRLPAARDRLVADLGLAPAQIDELIASGARYRERYADGTYGYRLLRLASGAG
jgi:cyclopropane fatty-acyl-phospholipid synthase-like methyltransferase